MGLKGGDGLKRGRWRGGLVESSTFGEALAVQAGRKLVGPITTETVGTCQIGLALYASVHTYAARTLKEKRGYRGCLWGAATGQAGILCWRTLVRCTYAFVQENGRTAGASTPSLQL